MITHTSTNVRPPLWKQLLGAVVGMSVALGIYAVYTFAAPYILEMLPASITTPKVQAAKYTQADRRVNQDRVIELAKKIAAAQRVNNRNEEMGIRN